MTYKAVQVNNESGRDIAPKIEAAIKEAAYDKWQVLSVSPFANPVPLPCGSVLQEMRPAAIITFYKD